MSDDVSIVPSGLADPRSAVAYKACVQQQRLDEVCMAPEDRAQAMVGCANEQLMASGEPPVGLDTTRPEHASGVFKHGNWSIQAKLGRFDDDAMMVGELGDAENTIYHEARHSEQWYQMARMQAGLEPDKPYSNFYPANAMAATDPINACDASTAAVEGWTDSVYGAGREHRDDVLNRTGAYRDQAAYCDLPEEADAWAAANQVSPMTCYSGE